MTISFVGLGTYAVSNGSSPMFPTPHASATADDLHILLVGWKADSGIAASGLMPHIDGWVPLGAAFGGAMDNLCQFAYYRIGTPTTPKVVTPNFVVTDGFAQQIHYKKTAAYWDIGWCGVDDNTSAANLSATTYTFQTFQPAGGDIILALIGLASGNSSISADTFTQSGITFGTVTVHTAHDSPNFHFRVLSAPVAAGSTTATITYSHTRAANSSGSGIILRLNEYNLTSGEVKRRTPQPWSVPMGTSTNIALPMMSTFDDGNNLHIAFIGIKPFDAEIVPPEGWRLLAEITNGTTGSGSDTGSVKVAAYYKFGTLLDQTSHGIPITRGIVYEWLASSSSVWIGWIETYSKYSARPWAVPLTVVGTDSSHGSNYSATATAALAATAPDALLTFTFLNTDAGTPSSIGLSLSGATLGTLLTFFNTDTTLGHDAAAILNFAQVVSGTGSGSPQLTFTNASSSSGATIFVCLRQNPEVTATVSAPPSDFSLDQGRYIINLTNIYPYLDALSIVRISDTNNYRPEFVVSAEVVETPMEFYDYEFHYAATDSNDIESFHYQIDFYIGTNKVGEVLTSSVTPHTDRLADPNYTTAGQHPGTYIKNPRAELCMPVTIGSFDSYRRDGRILGEHHILGNPYPVVVTDLMSSMRGRFSILVYADANWIGTYGVVRYLDELRELFDVGQPLYFQTIWPWMSGIPDFHFVVRSYEVDRRSRVVHMNDDDDRSPIFEVTVEFVETAPPGEESILTPITWASLAQNYNLWKNMTAANVTWLDVLNDG